jgi:glyoxylase-like metal-dependent hydrolase (beta-lactamase superfamily II)
MKVADGVEMLEISANVMGKPSVINPTLIWDKDTAIVIDTGFPGQSSLFREAIEKVGIAFEQLNLIILTHHDIDHVGSLLDIKKELPEHVKVLSHEEEMPYVQGEKCPIKVAQLEARLESLPEEMKEIYQKLKVGFQNCKAKVDITLKDKEELPYCGGISVIYTPGHTPGHICLYLKQSKILIAGDILSVVDGLLVLPSTHINYDNDMNLKSLKKLIGYDIQTVICYHGGMFRDNVNKRIKELISQG